MYSKFSQITQNISIVCFGDGKKPVVSNNRYTGYAALETISLESFS